MNEVNYQRTKSKWRWLFIVVNLIVCLAVLAAAVGAIIWINQTEPVAEKVNSTRKSSALVDTVSVRRGTYSPNLVVLGTVEAAQQISLRPRVSGQVEELTTEFVPGGMVKEGDLLLQIDPADFDNALSISESELEQAEASMEIEKARQQLAEKELNLLGSSIGDANRSLVLREPQIASMQAEVSAAEAAVERAQLDLDRTKVFAPFDAQVLTRSVNVGSQVGPGDELGQLIGLEEYWIMAAVPVRSLRWVKFPKKVVERTSQSNGRTDGSQPHVAKRADAAEQPTIADETNGTENSIADNDDESTKATEGTKRTDGSRVTLRNPDAWGPGISREGRVSRLIGTLDQQTRLARVLIIVDDPLGLTSNAPPLILDTLLETEIEGQPIEDVVRLKRDYVHDRDTVWVMKNDKLEIRETEVIFRDAEYAYIRRGLDDGDEVITTTLATVAEGIGLRKISETDSEHESTDDSPVSEGTEIENSESAATKSKKAAQ